ncbi:MAG: hypothetical protein JO027_06200 [Solirubrobacterales bacterium]|nr:hypothetical protein [Solirubrobacterales bacterium]
MPEHSYYTYMDERPVAWDPHDPSELPFAGAAYIGGYLREFERHWLGPSLSFYVTHHTIKLPTYGSDVVVVLLNDEWFRTPAYTGCVRAILRNLPGQPWFPWDTLAPPSWAAAYAAANHVRVVAEGRRSDRHAARAQRARGWPAMRSDNAIDVPLGYYHQPEKPITPLHERTNDVFFAGSLLHDMQKAGWKRALKRLAGNPKTVYRRIMIRELEQFRRRRPEVRAKVTVSGDFRALADSDVSSYADDMMDARIALVPRGTAAESYRLFEAWRYGCIVVCEQLPPRWFLQGAPAITLRAWSELEPVLDDLLSDPERQQALHEASLAWWRDVCAEQVVGRRLAKQLR